MTFDKGIDLVDSKDIDTEYYDDTNTKKELTEQIEADIGPASQIDDTPML